MKVYHGIENIDFKKGVVPVIILIRFFGNKYIQEVFSF